MPGGRGPAARSALRAASAGLGQVRAGVAGFRVDPDLEVQVVAGRVARGAHEAQDVALVEDLALGAADAGLVAVERGHAVAVVEDDGVAVAAEPAGEDDLAGLGGVDRRAGR